jgi:hypothetical protein
LHHASIGKGNIAAGYKTPPYEKIKPPRVLKWHTTKNNIVAGCKAPPYSKKA